MRPFRRFGPLQWALLGALCLVLLFTVWQTAAAVRHGFGLRGPHPDEPIAAWMTARHVARIYRVPPEAIQRTLGLAEDRFDRRPLSAIAQERGVTFEELGDQLRAGIESARAAGTFPTTESGPPRKGPPRDGSDPKAAP